MSRRVATDGRAYDRTDAPIRSFHRPVIKADAADSPPGTMTRCDECRSFCYAVLGPTRPYWRHEPDTFWTSR